MNETANLPTLDRAHVEALLARVAICAISWYPHRDAAEPGYSIDDDQRWCLRALEGADPGILGRYLVVACIQDPTRHRRELVTALRAVTAGEEDG